MQTTDIHAWVADQLRDVGKIEQQELESVLDGYTQPALFFLEFLVTRGVVRSERQGDTTVYTLTDTAAFENLVAAYLQPDTDDQRGDGAHHDGSVPEDRHLVVSVPLDMQPDLEALQDQHPDVDVLSLRDAVAAVLESADDDVRLAVPFFEQSGLNTLLTEMSGLASRGVDIRLLTRGVQHGDGYDHTNKCRALAKLQDLYEANKQVGATLSMRDFGYRISGHPQAPSRHYRGIHQKMVIGDATVAYVGSGEIRENSFLTNGEAGTLTIDVAEVAFWRDFFDLFWDSASPIEDVVSRTEPV